MRVGVGVYQAGAGVRLHPRRRRLAGGDGGRAGVQGGALTRDVGPFGGVGAFRHHHVARDAPRTRGQGQRGAMVAGRMRDHAAGRRRFVQRPYGVARAAELEGARPLQRLGLEMQLAAGQRIQCARAQDGRGVRMGCDTGGGGKDVVVGGQGHRHAERLTHRRGSPPAEAGPHGQDANGRRPDGLSTDSMHRADAAYRIPGGS